MRHASPSFFDWMKIIKTYQVPRSNLFPISDSQICFLRYQDAQTRAKQQGYSFRCDARGDLHLWQIKPVFIRHPVTGERIWFNQAYNHNSTHEKVNPRFIGTDIPDEKMPRNTPATEVRSNRKCCNSCGQRLGHAQLVSSGKRVIC